MSKDEVKAELLRDPFVPLRIHLKNHKTVSVPFREAAHILGPLDMIVFRGLKPGGRVAKGHVIFGFESILRIEQLRGSKGGLRRRKAS
jgi:hypothetical protein